MRYNFLALKYHSDSQKCDINAVLYHQKAMIHVPYVVLIQYHTVRLISEVSYQCIYNSNTRTFWCSDCPRAFENHPRWWYPKIFHTRAYGPLVIYFWISSPWMIFKPLGISEHQNVLVFSLHIHSYQPRLRLGWYEKNIALGPSVLVRYFWYHTPRSILPCDII